MGQGYLGAILKVVETSVVANKSFSRRNTTWQTSPKTGPLLLPTALQLDLQIQLITEKQQYKDQSTSSGGSQDLVEIRVDLVVDRVQLILK